MHSIVKASLPFWSICSLREFALIPARYFAAPAGVTTDGLLEYLPFLSNMFLLSGFSREQAASIVSEVRVELNPELQGRVGI